MANFWRRSNPCARLFPLILLLVAFCVPASGQVSQTKPLITQPVRNSDRIVLKGNVYPLARAEFDRGPAPSSLPMDRMILVLKQSPQQNAALGTLLAEQQEKSSPNYHRWLTPTQFGEEFGLANQDVQTVVNWLESQGFEIDSVAKGRGAIEFSGDAGQVQQAFHTAIHQYVVNGKAHWANATDPEIPVALAPAVAGIARLNNFPLKPQHHVVGVFRKSQRTGAAIPVQPSYTFVCGSNNFDCYALGPYDFATIYNVLPLWNAGIDGTGQTIAIVGESDINLQDVDDFRSMFGLPAAKVNVIHNGPDPGILSSTGDETESDLDVEWSGAVAKDATIDFVVSESTEASQGVDLSAEYIVDNDLAPIMSESYGACEVYLGTAGNQFYDQLWEQAAAEGITVALASMDGGSAGCDQFATAGAKDGLAVSGLASTPYDVAVGGTDFDDVLDPTTFWNSTNNTTTEESAKGYIPEIVWNDTCTNPELPSLLGNSLNAEGECNDSNVTSQYPFLLQVVGGGGGASACTTSTGTLASCAGGYAKPLWQSGAGVPNDGKRDLPDVSLFAGAGFNRSFYIVCEADAQSGAACNLAGGDFLGVGGTSAATPAFAAIIAMVNQKTQSRQGNANYILYPLAAKTGASCTSTLSPASSCIFYDVGSGTNAMPCVTGSPDCVTNTVGDTYGVLSGYTATSGYDRATGLGSMNAANLVNDWSSVKFTPSATTLQLNGGSAVNITHGTAVTVAISVSPTSPVPTGDASLIATVNGNSFDAGTFTLSNGSISGSTSLLPGGTSYGVVAHYEGDGTYAASDSTPITVTVSPESSQTFANLVTLDTNGNLTSYSATSATYGAGYYLFRVDVGNSAATFSSTTGISSTCSNHTASCPTGTVSVTNNGSALAGGPFPLNVNGYAEDQSLVPGAYAITASYPGDASYGASTGTASFSVAHAPTTLAIAWPGSGGEVPYGTGCCAGGWNVQGAIATTSDGIEPTGTFTFSVDGSPLPVTGWVYGGGPFQSPSTYASYWGQGVAPFAMSIGSHTLTVQYSGDQYYAPAAVGPISFSVVQAQPSFGDIQANPLTVQLGQPTTLTVTLNGSWAGVAPTGPITFYNGTTALSGTVSYTSAGPTANQESYLAASMTWTPTQIGNNDITAQYPGDTNYLTATSFTTVVDAVAPSALTLTSSPASFVAGQNVTLTAQVTSSVSGGPAPTGSVSFTLNGALLGTGALNSSGQAQFTTNALQGTSATVVATYSGDVDYASSTASITLVGADFALSTSPNPASVTIASPGGSASATVTASSENGFTGSVTFSATCATAAEISCSVSPSSGTLSSTSTSVSTTVTVNTTAPSFLPSLPPEVRYPSAPAVGAAFLLCLALLLMAIARRRRWNAALAFLLLASVLALASCGGGSSSPPPPSNPGTPAGSYVVTVTATSGAVTHSTNVNVSVQ